MKKIARLKTKACAEPKLPLKREDAVSYTHLDVYKRQGVEGQTGGAAGQVIHAESYRGVGMYIADGHSAVSYTHLDVYKRQ